MKVELEQGTAEWHFWRADGIGGSDIAAIMGLNPYKTPYQLWLERTGRVERPVINEAMRHGIENEESARRNYCSKTGIGMGPACYQHDEHEFIRASLDGITYDGKSVIDFKCPQWYTYALIQETNRFPEYWIAQVRYNMLAANAERGELSAYNDARNESIEIEIERSAAFDDKMIAAASQFWQYIQTDTPPEKTDADLEYKFASEEDEYIELLEQEADIKKRKEQLRESLIKRADGHDYRSTHLSVKCRVDERVQWRKLAEELDPEGVHRRDFVKEVEIWTVRKLKRDK